MAKQTNFKTVVFAEDFATKKAGEEFSCDGMLASSLVKKGVAKYKDAELQKAHEAVTVKVKEETKSKTSKKKSQ
jgi:hypothetical protein